MEICLSMVYVSLKHPERSNDEITTIKRQPRKELHPKISGIKLLLVTGQ